MAEAEHTEILLVEDYEPDAQYLGYLLRRSHVTNPLKLVSDGHEALDFLLCQGAYRDRNPAQMPKVVLLDIRLPKVDGVGVLRQIKQDTRTRSIPVIVLTGSKFEEDLEQARQAGADGFLTKPISLEAMQRACRQFGFELRFG